MTHPPNPIVRALCEFLLLALAALPDGAAPGPYPLDERGALLHVVPTARVEIPSSRRMDAAARCWSTEVTADIARAASVTSMDVMGLNLSAIGRHSPFLPARLAIWLELRPCGLLHWHDNLVAT